MRGRKPQPTRLKVLRGNPGQRRLNTREPKIRPGVPNPPDWLSVEARKKFEEVATSLAELGILTNVDGDVLTLYSEAWVEFKQATLAIREHGLTVTTSRGEEKSSPYAIVRNKALVQLRTLAAELGMSPSGRSRLHTLSPLPPQKSKWAGILT